LVKLNRRKKAQRTQKIPRMDTNGREEEDEPQIDQPSREAMAGKLQIFADRGVVVALHVSRFIYLSEVAKGRDGETCPP
jgi:hypothetical protein